jgi:hypothetical protein
LIECKVIKLRKTTFSAKMLLIIATEFRAVFVLWRHRNTGRVQINFIASYLSLSTCTAVVSLWMDEWTNEWIEWHLLNLLLTAVWHYNVGTLDCLVFLYGFCLYLYLAWISSITLLNFCCVSALQATSSCKPLNVVVEWLTRLLRFREVPGSYLGRDTGYPDWGPVFFLIPSRKMPG